MLFRSGDETLILDFIEDRNSYVEPIAEYDFLQSDINELLHELKPKEEEIIRLRFGLTEDKKPKTLEEVGEIFGVTRDRIRQIEVSSLKKLKSPSHRRKLHEYL